MGAKTGEFIEVVGARQNNLEGIDLKLPLAELIVVTGVSGSGKSSLPFATIYLWKPPRIQTFLPNRLGFFAALLATIATGNSMMPSSTRHRCRRRDV